MKNHLKKFYFLLLIVLLGLISLGLYVKETYFNEEIFDVIGDKLLVFNCDSGIYDDTITLKISKNIEAPIGSKIYYTLNGDDPTEESNLYNGKIELNKEESLKVYPLKVRVIYNNIFSKIFEKTFIMGDTSNIDIPIISLTTNNFNLYDFNEGILVQGVNYQEGNALTGNYYMRGGNWIKDSHMTMLNNNSIIYDNDIGIEVAGGTSSAHATKSFKLYFGTNKFIYNTFSNNKYSDLNYYNEFITLKIRSGSQDLPYGTNTRNSIASKLSEESDFSGYNSSNRAIVFLNGNFYSICTMENMLSGNFLSKRYNLPESDLVEVYKGYEERVLMTANIKELFLKDLNDYNNRVELENVVDMDDYLKYCAIQILLNNVDWPYNNYKIWRYTGNAINGNKFSDGKYRFLLFDLDLIYYKNGNAIFFEGQISDVFVNIMENINRGQNSVLKNVLKTEIYRDKFTAIILDLLNTSFERENLLKIIEEEYSIVKDLQNNYFDYNFDYYQDLLLEAASEREDIVIKDIESYFKFSDKYKFNIDISDGVNIKFGGVSFYGNNQYSNEYYRDMNLYLSAEVWPGYDFEYYLINGKKYYDSNITIDKSFIKNNKVDIEVVTKKKDIAVLVISEISTANGTDRFRISNVGSKDINTSNYYMSDDISNLKKYKLPNISLKPNNDIEINGKNNYYAIGEYISNFNLSKYETLYLTDGYNIIDSIVIPRMSSNEYYGRYLDSNRFVYYLND